MYNQVDESLFEAWATKIDQEDRAREIRKNSNFEPLEEINWLGLETGVPAIVRMVGAPEGFSNDPDTALITFTSLIKDDDGKYLRIYHPDPRSDREYILNKIINEVTRVNWVNGERQPIYEEKAPDIYNIVTKNGLTPNDPAYRYNSGWSGRGILLVNVIDRVNYEWHRENKKTKLLAKSVRPRPDGSGFYVEEGVPSYVFRERLKHLITSYGGYNAYDLMIMKTGKAMSDAYQIIPATFTPREVPKDYQQYISNEDKLTDEELSWSRVPILERFKNTSATKLFNRLQKTIKKIDAACDTDFYDQLYVLVEKERKEKAEQASETPSYTSPSMIVDEPVKNIVEEKVVEIPKVEPVTEEIKEGAKTTTPQRASRARVAKSSTSNEAWRSLPYGDSLPDELKPHVKSVIRNADGVPVDIEWEGIDEDQLVQCFNEDYTYPDGTVHKCICVAPSDTEVCAICGQQF